MLCFSMRYTSDTLLSEPLQVIVRFIALKEECLHGVTKEPYIKSITGGADNSIEGLQVSRRPPKSCTPFKSCTIGRNHPYFHDRVRLCGG